MNYLQIRQREQQELAGDTEVDKFTNFFLEGSDKVKRMDRDFDDIGQYASAARFGEQQDQQRPGAHETSYGGGVSPDDEELNRILRRPTTSAIGKASDVRRWGPGGVAVRKTNSTRID